jgi:hypothetical protein
MAEARAGPDAGEVDYKYLQAHCKKLLATLPVFNNQGKLVQRIQKGVTGPGKKPQYEELLVNGVDTKLWPNWVVHGVNPMLLSEKELSDAGLEVWYLLKTSVAFWHPRLFLILSPLQGPEQVQVPWLRFCREGCWGRLFQTSESNLRAAEHNLSGGLPLQV